MSIFRMFSPHAPASLPTRDPTFPESPASGETPNQSAPSPVSSEPMKADEIMRLMAERRPRKHL